MGRDGKSKPERQWRWLALLAVAMLAILLPSAGDLHAEKPAPALVCSSAEGEAHACSPGRLDLEREHNLARFEVAAGSTPSHVVSRTSKFAQMAVGVTARTPDGRTRTVWSYHDFEAVQATFFDRQFAVPLPAYEGQPTAVLVEVTGATQFSLFDHMHLVDEVPGSSMADLGYLLVVALFAGMMLVPLIFDLAFYRVLQEKFLLWHAALVVSLAIQLVCNFGLYVAYFDVTLPMVRVISIGSFTLMACSAIMFVLRFIERDTVPQRLRKTLFWLMIGFACLALVHMAGIEALKHWPATLFFGFGLPLCIAFIATIVVAVRNGSPSARYIAVGMAPLMVVALLRVVTFLLPGVATVDAHELMMFASLIEVIATALGVASRFIALKHERDRARTQMGQLEDAADHDPLTGLLNRRAIDTRYKALRAQGFDTLALIDLDRFKDINDRYGHQVGDAVLRSCADAIRGDGERSTIAVRLGGEEFVLLLRGERATARAEAIRQDIPRRIAAEVPGLDRMVTASMGVIELPRDSVKAMDFDALYARADTLLYEAKAAGRNRMLFERLSLFEGRSSGRARTRAA